MTTEDILDEFETQCACGDDAPGRMAKAILDLRVSLENTTELLKSQIALVTELRAERDAALARRDELIELRADALEQRNLYERECRILKAEREQLGKNVTHWMEESFKWNKRSQDERAQLAAAQTALLSSESARCVERECITWLRDELYQNKERNHDFAYLWMRADRTLTNQPPPPLALVLERLVGALKDNKNHWHVSIEDPKGKCSACNALAEVAGPLERLGIKVNG